MPPKKTQTGRKFSSTRRMNDSYKKENPAEREARLERDRIRNAARRANETFAETEERQERGRNYSATRRANQTPEEAAAYQESDRISHASRRSAMTSEEAAAYQESNRISHASRRSAMTLEDAAAYQESDRISHASRRMNETPEQRENRLAANRNRATKAPNPRPSEWENTAFQYLPGEPYGKKQCIQIGNMNVVCDFCMAKKWRGESAGMCCTGGKVSLLDIEVPPEPLKSLLDGSHPHSRHFLQSIRKYNSSFQMTSFGVDEEVRLPGYFPTFKVCGQIYHRIGSILPLHGEQPKFLQIYFTGNEEREASARCSNIPGIKHLLVLHLQDMLHQHNAYVKDFKTALEQASNDNIKLVIHADKTPAGEHARRYNAPELNEVAVVIVGEQYSKRDIILHQRSQSNQLKHINETHRAYDALQYPIIFWKGQDGYNFNIWQIDPKTGQIRTGKKISSNDFYAYRIMFREDSFNVILRCHQLFHQYIVDMYVKVESERLLFLRRNQAQLRVADYIHLRDSLARDGHTNVGQMVILPSSFTGGPRYMQEKMQDAMTYVKTFGRPDLFITLTCNPQWPEITHELLAGQVAHDRHDLIARVFQRKVILLIDLMTKGKICGPVIAHIYSIEWQKRGLPHVHTLFWLKDKLRATQINNIIVAEFPNPQEDPTLFDIVRKHMVHGPCGLFNSDSVCMKEGKCAKNYPKHLIQETQTGEDGYPLYRRRAPEDGGYQANVRVRGQEITVDNKWVVPYCPLLSKIFNAHCNVEYCNSVKAIKYICKYICKGSDQAIMSLEQNQQAERQLDEIRRYEHGRYVSSNEAIWRILNFPIHGRNPTVQHLSVHLENGQRIYFTEQNADQRVATPPKTTLTGFFELCQHDLFATTLLYHQVPKYYTWTQDKKWKRRAVGSSESVNGFQNIKTSDALGRVYTVHPNNFECFCARLLLHNVFGPKDFGDLRTVNGIICDTNREACLKLGLLESDAHWELTLQEATATQIPSHIRQLFAIVLTTCSPSNPKVLWENHREAMTEDIKHRIQLQTPATEVNFTDEMFNEALIRLENIVTSISGKAVDQFGLPAPHHTHRTPISREYFRETNYNVSILQKFVNDNEPLLVDDQIVAYQKILNKVEKQEGGLVFLDAPGGTGKTFVTNVILAKIRMQGKICLAIASSGIAATLLTGGRTAHSALKLPLNLTIHEQPVCRIAKGTEAAKVLKDCQLIVWDECTMSHKNAFEALDRTMKDIKETNCLMGGVVVVLSGDFRQTLPVVPKGTPADELKACLKSSYLWQFVETVNLHTNMRVKLFGDKTAGDFSRLLLQIGNGQIPNKDSLLKIPDGCGQLVSSLEDLMNKVYPNLTMNYLNKNWLSERAILAPRNDAVNLINNQLIQLVPGNQRNYKSVDKTASPEQAVQYPTEFLNSLELPGMPPHNLSLKHGCPIMLLRNLDAPRLCNGTRLVVKRLTPNLIEATILTGCFKGEDTLIPRIPLQPTDSTVQFIRLQFPVRLSFGMSINKSQGQSLKIAGLNLFSPCFSHGQFYVGCSRVGSSESLFIWAPGGTTTNIVYPQALQ